MIFSLSCVGTGIENPQNEHSPLDATFKESLSPDLASKSCEELRKEWKIFVSKNQDCVKDDDCALSGGGGGVCPCHDGISQRTTDSIVKSAKTQASKYTSAYKKNKCHLICSRRASKAIKPKCIFNKCDYTEKACE